MIVDYYKGRISVSIDGHKFMLNPSYTDKDGINFPESDYTEYCKGTENGISNILPVPQIVQAAFVAVKDLAERSEGKAVFNPTTATIRYGSEVITPENFEAVQAPDVKAFATAIYTYNNGEQRKVYEALQAEVIKPSREPEPLTPEEERALEEAQALEAFNAATAVITAGYTEAQVNSWPEKARQAALVKAGETTGTAIVDREAQLEGRTRGDVADSILALGQKYSENFIDAENAYKVAMTAIAEKYAQE